MAKAKVFGIGLSKTGTSSLTAALKRLGYKAKHYPHLFQVIETAKKCDAVTDTPVIVYFEALDRLWPTAKFILTVRDEDEWIDSCRRHYAKKPVSKIMAWKLRNRRAVYGMNGFDAAHFCQVARTHRKRVEAHFADRPGKLLVLDICAGEGYERLCPFLGLPVVKEKFPHKNIGRTS
jgi:hypothetical protein